MKPLSSTSSLDFSARLFEVLIGVEVGLRRDIGVAFLTRGADGVNGPLIVLELMPGAETPRADLEQ